MDAAEILDRHNKWRRGDECEMDNPKLLGEAIDSVLAELRELRGAVKIERNNALEHAALIVKNVAHSCLTEQHCNFLHAAHDRAAAEILALKNK